MNSYHLVDSYVSFLNSQDKYQNDAPMYLGEYLARTYQSELFEGLNNYLIWRTDKYLEICQVELRDTRLSIISVGRISTKIFDSNWQELLKRNDINQWIECCFVKDDKGSIIYDHYYDNLPLADDCNKIIGQLNADLCKMVKMIEGPQPKENVWLVGELGNQLPLINALIETYELKRVRQLPLPSMDKVEVVHTSNQVAGPSHLIIHTMSAGKDDAILQAKEWLVPIGQTTQVLASCDDDTATVRFGDRNIDLIDIFGNLQPDYMAYGEGWQIVMMRVEADLLGNQRLTIESSDGRCKDFVVHGPLVAKFNVNNQVEKINTYQNN